MGFWGFGVWVALKATTCARGSTPSRARSPSRSRSLWRAGSLWNLVLKKNGVSSHGMIGCVIHGEIKKQKMQDVRETNKEGRSAKKKTRKKSRKNGGCVRDLPKRTVQPAL